MQYNESLLLAQLLQEQERIDKAKQLINNK